MNDGEPVAPKAGVSARKADLGGMERVRDIAEPLGHMQTSN